MRARPARPARCLALSACLVAAGCGSSSGSGSVLSLVAVHAWDGGADAGCIVSTTGARVQCSETYAIRGNPHACSGFDEAGAGDTATCKLVCMSGLTCSLAGLSDGTNVVGCNATCASPEH